MATRVSSPGLPSRERGAAVSSENALLLDGIQFAMDHAVRSQEWVVVVCPTQVLAATASRLAMGVLPPESNHSGRTSRLPNGGKFSLVAAPSPVFVSEGTHFTVLFLGWSTATDQQLDGMRIWKNRATRVVESRSHTQAA